MAFINIDKVFKINVYKKLLETDYTWVEKGENKIFGWPFNLILSKWEGHYASFHKDLFTPNDFENRNLVEYEPKQGLYYKPHIDVFADSTTRKTTYYFDSIEELEIWIEENLKNKTKLIYIE